MYSNMRGPCTFGLPSPHCQIRTPGVRTPHVMIAATGSVHDLKVMKIGRHVWKLWAKTKQEQSCRVSIALCQLLQRARNGSRHFNIADGTTRFTNVYVACGLAPPSSGNLAGVAWRDSRGVAKITSRNDVESYWGRCPIHECRRRNSWL